MADIYEQLAETIVREQEKIIGPIAIEQARNVPGIEVNWVSHQIHIEGDEKMKLEQLVDKYKDLFGKISVEVCKKAIHSLHVPKDQLPTELQ
jgi:hypothetical protein